jgi:hypothetical protein
MTDIHMISRQTILAQGWTPAMIRTFLPEPVEEYSSGYFGWEWMTHYFPAAAFAAAQKNPDVLAWLSKLAKKRMIKLVHKGPIAFMCDEKAIESAFEAAWERRATDIEKAQEQQAEDDEEEAWLKLQKSYLDEIEDFKIRVLRGLHRSTSENFIADGRKFLATGPRIPGVSALRWR